MNDYILDTDFDLFFEKGDIKKGDSEAQAISLLLGTGQGHWKASVNTGIGFEQFVKSNEKDTAKTQITYGIEADGGKIRELVFVGEKLVIDAEWTIS